MSFVPVGIDENSDLPQEARERLAATIAVRPGGTTGQALVKASDDDHDLEWGDAGNVFSADVSTIVAITRTAYDALGTPDANTLYVIDETA